MKHANLFSEVGESRALPWMGKIRLMQFLRKKNYWLSMRPRQFKIIPSLSDYRSTYRITNICNLNGKKSWICVLRALSKLYFEDQVFVILTQNNGSAFPKFTVRRLTPLTHILETCFFNHVDYFNLKMKYFENICVGQVCSCIAGAHL